MTTPTHNTDRPRLIEVAFPLRQASLDSVHEKNVRHGHISTLHIWPARRPLAASRAALIATLLPDPGTPEARKKLVERIGGTLSKRQTKDGEKEETKGGILHWGRESNPDIAYFREEIRKAYGGRAPRVLDPFAGGGAIPLEAMRLGCEVTAADINPVAWFILKCTLEYPQRLAGQTRPLPEFVLQDRAFLTALFKARGHTGKKLAEQVERVMKAEQQKHGVQAPQLAGMESSDADALPPADLAWHVRAWGAWVLERARADLAKYYPVVDGKPTVAYLWARTVTCKQCRALLPLLKTRWLCKKDNKRVVLEMEPNAERTGVVFRVRTNVPKEGKTDAEHKAYDKEIGGGTMSKSGAQCPCCGAIMTTEDIRFEGHAGRLGATMTAVVVDGDKGKEYRVPTDEERAAAEAARDALEGVFADVPFGLPTEPTPKGGSGAARAFSVDGYGFDQWGKLFTPRQLVALGTFVRHTRAARQALAQAGYPPEWIEALVAYLAVAVDRLADYNSGVCHWHLREYVVDTFQRFALQINWDLSEIPAISLTTGGYKGAIEWISLVAQHTANAEVQTALSSVLKASAVITMVRDVDVIVTDPPYYDAIPYSDLMDFFYVWLRRTLHGLNQEIDAAFATPLAPKWDHDKNDGELIDDASRFGGDKQASKHAYEDGMARAFQACHAALAPDGRLVIVFAHKQPDAWETLVAAIIRAGFVVDGSWPIQTEMANRTRALTSAALSSSVWLVCRKRPETARPGWDNGVLEEMRANITTKLRDFWDAGIRGPDFVWAATGPALEAYSKYPAVKKADNPGEIMTVAEFLVQARRIVVEFVVGRVLSEGGASDDTARDLDPLTTYYMLHRKYFGMQAAPVGPCILYAVSCGLRDSDLVSRYDLATRGGKESAAAPADDFGDEDDDEGEGADEGGESGGDGATLKLKAWNQRKQALRTADREGNGVPLIDRAHRLMHLWQAGDVGAVNEYVDAHGLGKSEVFHHFLQALIELSAVGSTERSLLESISNHLNAQSRGRVEQIVLPGAESIAGEG